MIRQGVITPFLLQYKLSDGGFGISRFFITPQK